MRLAQHGILLDRGTQLLLIERDHRLALRQVDIVRQQERDILDRVEDHLAVVLGKFHRDLRHGLGRGQHILIGEVPEDPVVEMDRVGEVAVLVDLRVQKALAAHHDSEDVHALLLGGGDQAVARGLGEAGLDAGGVGVFIAGAIVPVGRQQGVGIVHDGAAVDIDGFRLIAVGVGQLHEQRMVHGLARDEIEIPGGADMPVGRQAVGGHKMRLQAAELRGAGVHLLHKGVDRAGEIGADDVTGLVGRADHRHIQKLPKGDDDARRDAGRAAGLVHALAAVVLGGDLVVQADAPGLQRLEREEGSHDLCQARRGALLILVELIENVSRVEIHYQRRLPVEDRRVLRPGRGGRGGEKQRQQEQQGKNLNFFHFLLPFSPECVIMIKTTEILYRFRQTFAT